MRLKIISKLGLLSIVITVFLLFGELAAYFISSSQLHNQSVILMRYDEFIYGFIGMSPPPKFENPYISREIPLYKDATIGSPPTTIIIGNILKLIPAPYPFNIIFIKSLFFCAVLYSLYLFYRNFFGLEESQIAFILTYMVPSLAFISGGVLYLLNILSNKHLYRIATLNTVTFSSLYYGLCVILGFTAIGSLVRTKKINLYQSILFMFSFFFHPVISAIYFLVYVFFIIYYRIKNKIYYLGIIILGLVPWIFIMGSIGKDYLILIKNNFSPLQVAYNVWLYLSFSFVYLLIIIYFWYKKVKIAPWKWIIFILFFLLILSPETKFALIRNTYLLFPFTVFTVIIVVSGYKILPTNTKKALFSIILFLGAFNYLGAIYFNSTQVIVRDNSEMSLLYTLKEYPPGAVLARDDLSYLVPAISHKKVLLGVYWENSSNLEFYQQLISGNASINYKYANQINYLLAPCNSTPNLGFQLNKTDNSNVTCIWSK